MRWQIANRFADQYPGNAGPLICAVPNWPGGPGWLLYTGTFTGGALLNALIEVHGLVSAVIPDLAGVAGYGYNQNRPFSAPAGTITFVAEYPNPGDAISQFTAFIVTPDA